MTVSVPAFALNLPFVCTSNKGILGMTSTLEDAQQHCQNSARIPLTWTCRGGRRWIARDATTGLIYIAEQLLF